MILFVPASYNINYDMKEVETPWHLLSQDNGCKPWCSSCKPVTKKTLNTWWFPQKVWNLKPASCKHTIQRQVGSIGRVSSAMSLFFSFNTPCKNTEKGKFEKKSMKAGISENYSKFSLFHMSNILKLAQCAIEKL